MDSSVLILAAVLAGGALLLLIAWRAVRFVMRLALVGVMILLVLAGALAWWYGSRSVTRRPATTAPRR